MSNPPVLAREFYQRSTEAVARDLLGKVVVRLGEGGIVAVRLTEVEAYLGVHDPACHTFKGRRTPRTETMWGEAGHAYLYLVYGMHHCLNVVTLGPDQPEAVLIRGGVPVEGLEVIRRRRGTGVTGSSLTDGPGKLCQALALTREHDGVDLCDPSSVLRICDDGLRVEDENVARTPRVGVGYAGEAASWPLRLVTDSTVFRSSGVSTGFCR